MNIVEEVYRDYLRTASVDDRAIATELSAVPIYRGWTGTIFLTIAGEFLFRDEESDQKVVQPETDNATQMVALVEAVQRYSLLVNLLPKREFDRQDCDRCGGSGRVWPSNVTSWMYCGTCHGLGWPGRIEVPLNIPAGRNVSYPSFDDAVALFSDFARSQGFAGEVLFIHSSDAFVVRGQTYVPVPSPSATRAAAKERYDQAARRRLGVVMAAAGSLSPTTVATYVYGPVDPDEAERLLFPDGLKLSVPQNIRRLNTISGITASVLRLLRGRSSLVRSVEEWFK